MKKNCLMSALLILLAVVIAYGPVPVSWAQFSGPPATETTGTGDEYSQDAHDGSLWTLSLVNTGDRLPDLLVYLHARGK